MAMDITAMGTTAMVHFIATEMEYTREPLDKMGEFTQTETLQHRLLITIHAY